MRDERATNANLEGPSPLANVTIALGPDRLHMTCVNKDMIIERSEGAVLQAQELYRKFHARCFWSYRADLEITAAKITWVRDGLRRHGGMAGWRAAQQLRPD